MGGGQHLTSSTFAMLENTFVALVRWGTGVSDKQVVLGTTFDFPNYYKTMGLFLVAGLTGIEAMHQWFLHLPAGSSAKVKSGPGPNTTLYLGWQDVRDRLASVGEKFVDGSAQRQNELGIQIQNGVVWPNSPGGERKIFLGSNVDNHAFVRPLFAQVLDKSQGTGSCDGSTCWNRNWLTQQAKTWLTGRYAIESSDFSWYVTKILHKVHMNIDLTDAEAQDFVDYMGKVLLPTPFPEEVARSCPFKSVLSIPETLSRRSDFLAKYREAIKVKIPNRNFTYAELDLVASAFLDSLQFAGGIAVPTIIQYVLALTHMNEERKWPVLKNLQLTSVNIPNVVWETLRLYPPVGAFPYWEKDGNGDWKHIVLSVAEALRDADVWPEPSTFKFRDMSEYSAKFTGFADFATHPPTADGGLGPHEHICPGKLLAVAIIETFVEEFANTGIWYATDPAITVSAVTTSSYTLTRSDHTCWEVPHGCHDTWNYNGRIVHGCTTLDSYLTGNGWCATTSSYVWWAPHDFKYCKPKLCDRSPCCCKYSACSTKALLGGYAKESHNIAGGKSVCCKSYPGSRSCPGRYFAFGYGLGYHTLAESVDATVGNGLCPAEDHKPSPYTPEQKDIDAVAATKECQGKGSSEEKASCACQRAEQASASFELLVRRCTAMTAVAQDIASPYGCSVRRPKAGWTASCKATAPLHIQLLDGISQAWNSIPTWGNPTDVSTDECYPNSALCCSQGVLGTESAACRTVTADTLSRDWLDLPPQLQGVFWLLKQGDSPSLMSFGRTADGCNMSPGKIASDGNYKVRITGDRSWSFHTDDALKSLTIAELTDLVYDFQFDSPTNPKFAQITPVARNVLGATMPAWLLTFNMTLKTGAATPGQSVTWLRTTWSPMLGRDAPAGLLTQVIDGAGTKLQPAFDEWVAYCESPELSGTSSPGKIHFNAFRG
jgi:hypothetical protein